METMTKHSYRAKLDSLKQRFSNALLYFFEVSEAYSDANETFKQAYSNRVLGTDTGTVFKAVAGLVLALVVIGSDFFIGLDLMTVIIPNATEGTIQLAAAFVSLVLVSFSIVFTLHAQTIEEEASISPGIVPASKLFYTRVLKYGVPVAYYAATGIAKIVLLSGLPGSDTYIYLTQIIGFVLVSLIGAFGHLTIIVIGPKLYPSFYSWIHLLNEKRMQRKLEALKANQIKAKRQATDLARNLITAYKRGVEQFPDNSEFFVLEYTTEEKEFIQSAFYDQS